MINPANRKSNSQLTNDITSPHREGKKKSAFPKNGKQPPPYWWSFRSVSELIRHPSTVIISHAFMFVKKKGVKDANRRSIHKSIR